MGEDSTTTCAYVCLVGAMVIMSTYFMNNGLEEVAAVYTTVLVVIGTVLFVFDWYSSGGESDA